MLYLNNGVADIFGYGRMMPPMHEPPRDLVVNLDVQRGLHCLTAAPWEVETARRLRNSADAAHRADGYFEFGISLHAYGDSYAHRDHNGLMYPPIVGHAAETLQSRVTGDVVLVRHPDGLTPSRRDDYTAYVTRLHGLFAACFPQHRPLKDAATTAAMLSRVIAWHPEPSHQIAQIRATAAASDGLNRPMNSYRPETNEDAYFDNFFYPVPYPVTRGHIDEGLRLARRWATS